MTIKSVAFCILVFVFAGSLVAAENPFTGTWKLNPAKSKFTGDTMKFEKAPAGAIRFSSFGLSYTFKVDGKEYTGPMGEVIAWKQIDDHTWVSTTKVKGNLYSTDTSKISPDGKTLTVVSKGTMPSGETSQTTAVYERISGEGGLFGGWRDKEVKVSSPWTLEIKASGGDGLVFTIMEYKETCDAKLDGKDYPSTGPMTPQGMTLALKRTDPRSIAVVQKQNGKPLFQGTYKVSQDGHTLTLVARPVAVEEPFTFVYERQ